MIPGIAGFIGAAAVNEDGRGSDSTPSNLFWGCGVDISNMQELRRPAEWSGQNKMGELLDMLRRRFDEADKEEKKIRENFKAKISK